MAERILGNRYLIKKQLGRGSHGAVYLCHDNKLHKDWAIKELEEPSDLERSMELELLKTISCNVFPRIVDIVKENGRVYLVMDYVEGITLKEKMKHQVVAEKDVLSWAKEIAKGIGYLHRMAVSILYMDCKPDNIMLTNGGEIRLVDLGSTYVCFKDKKQRISGTTYFAPKEQRIYEGEYGGPDVRTDIYAFGMTLYYLLSGGEKERRRGGRLCIKDVNPAVSWGMSHIIEKCTMENPEDRYQSMEEVEEQLQHIRKVGKQKESRVRLQRGAWFIGKVLCALAVLLLAYGYRYKEMHADYYLYSAMVVVAVFLLLCHTKKSVLYELNKDIFCGMGKRFLYLILLVGSMSGMSRLTTYAAEENTSKVVDESEGRAAEERLGVTLYDEYGRKILVRDGASWEIDEDIHMFISLDELELGEGKVSVFYESESGDISKQYSFEIIKKYFAEE